MPNMMIPDAGGGGGAGSVPLVVSPDKLRSTAEGFAKIADDLEQGPVITLASTHVEPCGVDAVSVGAAERFNHQISGGPGSGLWAISLMVQSLRDSAVAMTAAADQYDAQNQATADALRANKA